MIEPKFLTALGSPTDDEHNLHEEGLEAHIADQFKGGIESFLVGGTMGNMQLLRRDTYRRLVDRSIEICNGHGEILVGAGDLGVGRTLERIEWLNDKAIDGIVVLSPYFWHLKQSELIDYYTELADKARRPLYIYDLPGLTGQTLTIETYLELGKHPNIPGAKISGNVPHSIDVINALGPDFRVIIAEPLLIDVLLRSGLEHHLDGMLAIAPHWTVEIGNAAVAGDWEAAAKAQRKLTALTHLLRQFGGGGFTAMMNARGIPGRFNVPPYGSISESELEELASDPTMIEFTKS
jgi:dihydrodipicolinate synthase/N-acetylneuraminate lyase